MMIFILTQMSDKEEQRKRCSDCTIHDFDIKILTINPTFTFFHHVSVAAQPPKFSRLSFQLSSAVSYVIPVEKTFLSLMMILST